MVNKPYFGPELLRFLKQLKRNNDREWFQANKERYQTAVQEPALRFIAAFTVPLHEISPWMVADPRPSGGSLFRIYRDIRFSQDKSPYKTHLGIHFYHKASDEAVHGPLFYFHLQPGNCFAAAGSRHPDTRTLARIRDAIAWKPDAWKKAAAGLELEGESLARPPRGYSLKHPLIEDLKRKEFIATVAFTDAEVCGTRCMGEFFRACKTMRPLVAFLCKAVGLPF